MKILEVKLKVQVRQTTTLKAAGTGWGTFNFQVFGKILCSVSILFRGVYKNSALFLGNNNSALFIGTIYWHYFLALLPTLSHIYFLYLTQFSSGSSYSPLKIIMEQLFTSGSVNVHENLPPLCLGKYSAIFTSLSANNCKIYNCGDAITSG